MRRCAYGDKRAGRDSWWGPEAFWGVGGLSFRRRSWTLRCLASARYRRYAAEDLLFSMCVDAEGRRPVGGEELARFCSQDAFLEGSFGAHQIATRMNATQLPAFLDYCPEARLLVEG